MSRQRPATLAAALILAFALAPPSARRLTGDRAFVRMEVGSTLKPDISGAGASFMARIRFAKEAPAGRLLLPQRFERFERLHDEDVAAVGADAAIDDERAVSASRHRPRCGKVSERVAA